MHLLRRQEPEKRGRAGQRHHRAKNFVQIEATYKPDKANKAIYDKLFSDYKTLYAALKKPYIKANSRRFEGMEK